MNRIVKHTIGAVCIVVGLAALVTPFTPGAWLSLVGIELLGFSHWLPKRIRDPWQTMKKRLWEQFHRVVGKKKKTK